MFKIINLRGKVYVLCLKLNTINEYLNNFMAKEKETTTKFLVINLYAERKQFKSQEEFVS